MEGWPDPPPEGTIHLWLCAGVADSRCGEHLDKLPSGERERAERFRFETDRWRYVGSRIFLRRVLGHYLARSPRDLRFQFNRWGKPALPEEIGRGLQFNLSRSHDLALLGVGVGPEFGVDVERRLPERADSAIVRRQFSQPEQAYVERASDRLAAFFEIWTRKEAYLKGLGRGFSHPLAEFSVRPEEDGGDTRVIDWSQNPPRAAWEVRSIDLPVGGYAAALAACQPSCRIQLVPLAMKALLDRGSR